MRDFLKKYWLVFVLLLLALGCAVSSVRTKSVSGDEEHVVSVVQKNLAKRIHSLEKYAIAALRDSSDWLPSNVLPSDMTIYKYVSDTLSTWQNELPLSNDDIRAAVRYQRVGRPEYALTSPLAELSVQWSFVNLGPKWYVARKISAPDSRLVVAALEICSTGASGRTEAVNPHLDLSPRFYISPITGNLGSAVGYDGVDLFVINSNASDDELLLEGNLYRWLAMGLFVLASLAVFFRRKDWKAFLALLALLTVSYVICYRWGTQMATSSEIFSPAVYAGDAFLSSFGSLLLLNIFIVLVCAALFFSRGSIISFIKRRERAIAYLSLALLVTFAVGIVVYSIATLRSLILNSSILLEIQWLSPGVGYSLLSLLSYTFLMGSALMLLQIAAGVATEIWHVNIEILSRRTVTVASVVIALTMFLISGSAGFKKERSSVQVWANRLSVDRNLSLELSLRSLEPSIAQDEVISIASGMDNAGVIITNRLLDNYLYQYSDEYSVKVSICAANDLDCMMLFSRKLSGGSFLADDSRFVCISGMSGKSSYAAMFTYDNPINPAVEQIKVFVEILSRSNREDNGYFSVFTPSSKLTGAMIPPQYSYAKYVEDKLVSYRGTYPYPTVAPDSYRKYVTEGREYFRTRQFIHFICKISPTEVILISRPRKGVLPVLSSSLTLVALVGLLLFPLTIRHRKQRRDGARSYFKRRIVNLMIAALFFALMILAVISIKFVFDRNTSDSYDMMSSRISTIQTMVESVCQDASSERDLLNQEFRNNIVEISSITRSDINLYTLSGQVFLSTVPDVFGKQMLSPRMDDNAYREIVHNNQRLLIQKENFEGRQYYGLYAPIFNRDDEMVAILSSPFTQMTNLVQEAIPHAVLMILIVFALMVFFTTVARRVIARIFAPLSEVTQRMQRVSQDGLESIEYDRNDELTPLIDSYNRMIHDLAESNKILARTERDNAWSEMARQVAHEIKNPLTPMMLAIQRLIRLKQKNDSSWTEKFDDISKILMDQINILASTANEFSDFAKLYSESPVEINLDELLQSQTLLFDNKENISIEYIGTPDAVIMGPKPQLTRVIVNLLTNAVQALEIMQEDKKERGEEIAPGIVRVLLRESSREGWYEIAVEDNGPGVPAENVDKVFNPKFTTKSSGSGLGLAISRSIIEKCGGEILYRKSYSLDGACFLIRLPKSES